MIRFDCDYGEGAHPRILERLVQTNMEQTAGYGDDAHCQRAAALIRTRCGAQHAAVHFFVGGTQTNLTLIAAALRPHEGVVAADMGHINTHESGAVEATGHKVLALPAADGKLTAEMIHRVCVEHEIDPNREHTVKPALVYLSQATEGGGVYTLCELSRISTACSEHGLALYADGARIGVALCAQRADVNLTDMARLCDAFSIGGTKNGLLFGEALVITNDALKADFRYILKQKGGMLAKGRLLGVQFAAVFEDDLFFEMARHANAMAMRIKRACEKRGFGFLTPSLTNQQFPIMPQTVLKTLSLRYSFAPWQRIDDEHSAVRFCTSWATKPEDVDALVADIERA